MPFKKLFVTGGTGFIGSSLVAHLNSQGYQVSCLVRDHKRGNRLYGSSVRLYIGSLGYTSSVELEKMIEGHDAVLHLASISREQMIPWEDYVRTNVNGAEDILRASLSCGVGKLLYFSTVGVLGTIPRRLPGMEDAPYDPDCSYHRSKAFAEQKVLEWDRRGLNTTIIRPTITYGPRDRDFLFKMARLVDKGVFPLIGSGENKIHIVYIRGLIAATISALNMARTPRRIYTIADSNPLQLRELIHMISSSLERKTLIIRTPSRILSLMGKAYDRSIAQLTKGRSMYISTRLLSGSWYYSIDKAVNDLAYRPYDTDAQVKTTMDWYVGNGWL